jgi:uncharacterized membrane protein YhhN
MQPLTVLMIAAVATTLAAIYLEKDIIAGIAKVCASMSFIGIALAVGAHMHPLGRAFFAAFVLSLVGDVALIGRSKSWLSAGIIAFLCAHAAFVVAFFVHGVEPKPAAMGALVVVPASLIIGRWVLRHASADMRPKVFLYVGLITVMVACAAGTNGWLTSAAVLFYVSDICVARQRFVQAGMLNRLIGLPLYYAAQWMFALASAVA